MIANPVSVFVSRNNVSVLTTLLDNGQPHSSALHFAFSVEPFYFVFLTEKNSRKCQNLVAGVPSASSLVVGFDESDMETLQLEGFVEILSGNALEDGWKIYTSKYPLSRSTIDSKMYVLLRFIPNWWRYTDLKTKPWKIIKSE